MAAVGSPSADSGSGTQTTAPAGAIAAAGGPPATPGEGPTASGRRSSQQWEGNEGAGFPGRSPQGDEVQSLHRASSPALLLRTCSMWV